MKNFIAALLLLFTMQSFAQELNQYRYAIVPKQFGFSDMPDQYRMNTLAKLFMEKYGFITYFEGDILPPEVAADNCNKVFVDVISNSTLFTTKLNVVIRDCTNKVLYTSPQATSREKDNSIAFPQAMREAFFHVGQLNYKYTPAAAAAPTPIAASSTTDMVIPDADSQLFAQPVAGGYQIVDTTPKVVLLLRNTSAEGVFIAERNGLSGIVFNKLGKWYFEYYSNGKLMSDLLKIKF